MDRKLFKSILLIITYAVVLVMALARLDVVSGGPGRPDGRAPWRWSPPIWCW